MVAFEANPHTFKLLKANLLLNECNNVTLYNVAASDEEGTLDFLMNRANSGGAKRVPVQYQSYYYHDDPKVAKVRGVSLDQFLGEMKFDLILMDIEGSEYFALKGMQRLLASARTLAIEFLPHHIAFVAGVEIDKFSDTILKHFNSLNFSTGEAVLEHSNMRSKLSEMFHGNVCHDLIFFQK